MPILDCSVRTCYYNEENKCSLDSIKVEGKSADYSDDTACASFKLRDGSMTNACTKKPAPTSEVKCAAEKCIFNDNDLCKAEHIGIAGSTAEKAEGTECASFVSVDNK